MLLVTTWVKEKEFAVSISWLCSERFLQLGVTESECQLIWGRLKSPASHILEFELVSLDNELLSCSKYAPSVAGGL